MTDTPKDLTAPEAVERAIGMCRAHGLHGTEATLRALSAELEAEKARAEAAEAERDALKAQLAEAVGVATRLADWIEHEAGCDLPFDARAFPARHQKETDT